MCDCGTPLVSRRTCGNSSPPIDDRVQFRYFALPSFVWIDGYTCTWRMQSFSWSLWISYRVLSEPFGASVPPHMCASRTKTFLRLGRGPSSWFLCSTFLSYSLAMRLLVSENVRRPGPSWSVAPPREKTPEWRWPSSFPWNLLPDCSNCRSL